LLAGLFLPAVLLHAQTLAWFGLYYRWRVRHRPPAERVGALSFMAYAVMMPITYALLAPLAFWTLDSSSWETRGRPASAC
jgi:N-acetylglucosaminyltransferase